MPRGKDTTHKPLKIMLNPRAWPQQLMLKRCVNRCNIVALRFGGDKAKEILGLVGSNVC